MLSQTSTCSVGERIFVNSIRKIGLSRTGLEITMTVPLPAWVQSKRSRAAQVSDICATAATESLSNAIAVPMKVVVSPAIRRLGINAEGAVAGGTAGKKLMWQTTAPAVVTAVQLLLEP